MNEDGLTEEQLLQAGATPVKQQSGGLTEEQLKSQGAISIDSKSQDIYDYMVGNPSNSPMIERLKLSFTNPEKIRDFEERIGTLGKTEIGDIIDFSSELLPLTGGILGGLGGTIGGFGVGGIPGMAIGTAAGEAIRQSIGGIIKSFTEPITPEEQKDIILNKLILKPIKTGATTYLAGKTLKYVASRLPKLLGIAVGESDETIKIALKNPKAADLGLRNGDDALREAVRQGSNKSIELRDAFIKGHQNAFKNLVQKEGGKRLVEKTNLLNEFISILKNKGVKILPNQKLDFTTSRIKANPGEISKIKDTFEALNNWKDFSLEGVNKFKQLVGALTKFADDAGITSKSPTLGTYYYKIDSLIKNNLSSKGKQIYSGMNKKFSDNIELFDEMVDAFNRGDPFTKVAGALGKNKDTLRQILQFYENKSGSKILPIVSGREMAMEKTAAFGFLNPRSWIDFFWSPQSQAGMITKIGKVKGPIETSTIKAYQQAQKFVGKNIIKLK